MKIAFFTDCYLDLTGGITTVINAEKTELEKRGHTVYLFSSAYPRSKSEREALAQKHIFPVPSHRFFLRGLTPIAKNPTRLLKYFAKNFPELADFDVFYVHYEASCSIAGLLLAQKYKIPSVQVMHGREDVGETNIIPFGFRTLVADFLNFAHSRYLPHETKIPRDNYLAHSRATAKMWELMVNHANAADFLITPSKHFATKLEKYGVKKRPIVFPNGISDELFAEKPAPKTLAKNETLKIIWHSRISAEKRMMPFLEALTKVRGKYELDIYGGGGDFYRAKRFAKKHRLNARFHGNAPFSKVYAAVKNSHLDILVSSNFDTFGMTIIEAASAGVPTLIVDPDLAEIIPVGGGILARSPSPDDMAAAINDLLAHPEKLEQMSKILLAHRDATKISRRIDKLEQIFRHAESFSA